MAPRILSMEMTMPIIHNGECYIQQSDTCTICGETALDDGRPIMVVDSGKMEPMRRDPAFLKFASDRLNYDTKTSADALVDVFHAECLVECVGDDWGKCSPQQCDGCEAHFLKDTPKWAFRLRVGNADSFSGTFVANEDSANSAIICPGCFEFYLGNEEIYEGGRATQQRRRVGGHT